MNSADVQIQTGRGPKAYGDRQTDKLVHSNSFSKTNVLYFTGFSVRSSISELESLMLSDYLFSYRRFDKQMDTVGHRNSRAT